MNGESQFLTEKVRGSIKEKDEVDVYIRRYGGDCQLKAVHAFIHLSVVFVLCVGKYMC